MKLQFLLLICFTSLNLIYSQQFQLSPQAEVSVLTIGQGTNLNDAFGHNAFRIKDTTRGLDVVYDYGRYDFDTPNFYLKFVQGKLNYLLGRRSFEDFIEVYRYYDRTINEQRLNLNLNEKQQLYNYLINNHKPENRRYLYDFFYDNCATKIRDVTDYATNQAITYSVLENDTDKTFRALIHEHVGRNTWGSFGIDIALGSITDRVATTEQQMFLPKYIYKHFEVAKKASGPLSKGTKTIYASRNNTSYKTSFLWSPFVINTLIALVILWFTFNDYKKKSLSRWLDITLFSITGCSGIILLFLWFGTNHTATAYNYNLLWAFPLNLLVLGQFFSKTTKKWFKGYIKFLVIMLSLMCLHWVVGVQVFALAFLPILLVLIVRYLFLLSIIKNT